VVAALLLVSLAEAAAYARVLPPVRSRADAVEPERPPGVPDDATLEAAGATIGTIRFEPVNVFDPRIEEEDIWLFRLLNGAHIVTRESVIESQLLFRSGDPYSGRLLSESERILRSRSYLRDARVRPVAVHDNVVDIEVVTQDTWTLEPQFWISRKGGKNTGGFGIEESNLLGFGAELGLHYRKDIDRTSTTLRYRDPYLFGTPWRIDAQYADTSDGSARKLELERPFHALDARWSAGLHYRDDRLVDSVYENGNVVASFRTHESMSTVFGGWSTGLRGGAVVRWTFGVTRDERQASQVDPAVAGPLPADRDLVYPWIGFEWVQDDFRELRNFDQIGRTEDQSFGWHVQLQLGYAAEAFGSARQATVFETSVDKALEWGADHTVLLSGTAKGRVEDGSPVDTLAGVQARYFWRQSPRRALFLGISADRGWNLDIDQQLTLGGDNGLRGYPLRYRSGQRRWLFTAEQRWYTDWYPFRLFNVGGAVFYDMGATGGSSVIPGSPPPLPGQLGTLRDIGFGLRLGNTRIADVVHIDFAFPLDGDASISRFQFIIEGKKSF
jgi:hypothetical protein